MVGVLPKRARRIVMEAVVVGGQDGVRSRLLGCRGCFGIRLSPAEEGDAQLLLLCRGSHRTGLVRRELWMPARSSGCPWGIWRWCRLISAASRWVAAWLGVVHDGVGAGPIAALTRFAVAQRAQRYWCRALVPQLGPLGESGR